MRRNPYSPPSAPSPTSPGDRKTGGSRGRSLLWLIIAPLLALLAGPAIVSLLWALEVYVLRREAYVSDYERLDQLRSIGPIGIVLGVAGCIFVVFRFAMARRT